MLHATQNLNQCGQAESHESISDRRTADLHSGARAFQGPPINALEPCQQFEMPTTYEPAAREAGPQPLTLVRSADRIGCASSPSLLLPPHAACDRTRPSEDLGVPLEPLDKNAVG